VVVGFTNSVGAPALAEIARGARIPLVHDVGSGLLERYPEVPNDEPAVTEALAGGTDVVTFSGDKLLGGPQAGILTGRADLIDTLRRHPLARALRVDKMTVAALEAVLRLYATGRRLEIPLWTMLSEPQRSVTARARAVAKAFKGATVRGGHAVAGGGSLPEWAIPSAEMVLPVPRAEQIAARLRNGRPPVFARHVGGHGGVRPANGPAARRGPPGAGHPVRPRTGRTSEAPTGPRPFEVTGPEATAGVIATAGHVDHGKSSLIVRLTGIDPDRWAEEKRRGLTIDLGFAWLTLPSGREVGFVDVPGHERFIRNMLAGVGPVRLVVFVVAAGRGMEAAVRGAPPDPRPPRGLGRGGGADQARPRRRRDPRGADRAPRDRARRRVPRWRSPTS